MLPLKRKVTSTIGLTELIPVSCAGGMAEPLGSGYLSFTALTRSDGWIVVPADSEGFAAGTQVAVRSMAIDAKQDRSGHGDPRRGAARRAAGAIPRRGLGRGSAPALRSLHRSFAAWRANRCRLPRRLSRVLAADVIAPVDAPPFDRSNVDGFAVRAADTLGASDSAPKRLTLNAEVIACGVEPAIEVMPGTATAIATGGVIPRGADAVVMIEHTELIEDDIAPAIELRRAAASGQFISYAGSDIARGETLLRRGTPIGSREIGMLAACGFSAIEVVRRPRVAVLSTGDELVEPGRPLRPGGVYDSNGAIIAAAITEAGGEPVPFGAFPDEEVALELAMRSALDSCDMVVLSGGTSKGAGDLSHRIVSRLGKPGILVHGVALKPGKPLCLAVIGDKPLIVLPGFPTSAIFTFHAFVAPVHTRPRRAAARSGEDRHGAGAGADRFRTRPRGIRAGFARRRR